MYDENAENLQSMMYMGIGRAMPEDIDTEHTIVFPIGSDGSTITEEMVDEFIDRYEITKMGEKTTVVLATLRNGFVISESSSCVDTKNYNEEIGASICKERIKNKVWELLGFLLQTCKWASSREAD